MGWFPLFLNLENAQCLIVGGGKVAYRKAESLLAAGARLHIVSPDFSEEIQQIQMRFPDRVSLEAGVYTSRSLAAYTLVIAATDDRRTNQQVFADAQRVKVLVNVVDDPELCTFQAAALIRRGPLQIAVHTGGECPALAAEIRKEMETAYPDWLSEYATALGTIRRVLPKWCDDPEKRKTILQRLAQKEFRDQCRYLSSEQLVDFLQSTVEKLLR